MQRRDEATLNDSNIKDNSMINRRVSLFYQVFLESVPQYGLSVYLVECLYSVSTPISIWASENGDYQP